MIGLHHQVAKIQSLENFSLWQKLKSFLQNKYSIICLLRNFHICYLYMLIDASVSLFSKIKFTLNFLTKLFFFFIKAFISIDIFTFIFFLNRYLSIITQWGNTVSWDIELQCQAILSIQRNRLQILNLIYILLLSSTVTHIHRSQKK